MLPAVAAVLAYRPFLDPLPIWRLPAWMWMPLLLIPLTAGVAIVYKSIKCNRMAKVPRQSAGLTLWILIFMFASAVALTLLVRVLER